MSGSKILEIWNCQFAQQGSCLKTIWSLQGGTLDRLSKDEIMLTADYIVCLLICHTMHSKMYREFVDTLLIIYNDLYYVI